MNFKIIENGKEIECSIITTFKDNTRDINYVVYTDGEKDSNGEMEVYASRYVLENNQYILNPIERAEEWDFIDNMLEAKSKEVYYE